MLSADCRRFCFGLSDIAAQRFDGLAWPQRQRLLYVLRDAGVLWLQLTGGEPLIDPLFADVYTLAHELGMMISISTNGSRLADPRILDLFTRYRPYRLTLSVYGATAGSYDSLTRRRGAFVRFTRGLTAAHEAGLPIKLNLIVTRHNADDLDAMIAQAQRLGLPHQVFPTLSPTIYGGGENLPAQSVTHLRQRRAFTSCAAGHTFFHVDPRGWPRSARSAVTSRSHCCPTVSTDYDASPGSPTGCCHARAAAPVAPCLRRAVPACRWRPCTAPRGHPAPRTAKHEKGSGP